MPHLVHLFKRMSISCKWTRRNYCSNFDLNLLNPSYNHSVLRNSLREFVCEYVETQASKFNEKEEFNYDLFKKMGDLGFLGITIPKRYGGLGMDATALLIASEEISTSDPAFCLSYGAHSLLFSHNLAVNGSLEQCNDYLPRACKGEGIGGMGMSEAACGTDVLSMKTTGTLSTDGDTWLLNGSKMWVTNGAMNTYELGDFYLIYARTSFSGNPHEDFSLFLVEKCFSGFSLGSVIQNKLGMRASKTAELVFENCSIPYNNIVGQRGKALLCMMKNLEIERLLLAGMSIGVARRCLNDLIQFAKERDLIRSSQNGKIQEMISMSYTEYQAGKIYAYNVSRSIDSKAGGDRLNTDAVKLFCAGMAKSIADRAVQIIGEYGNLSLYPVQRLLCDSKLMEIGGGTIESHQKNITRDMKKSG